MGKEKIIKLGLYPEYEDEIASTLGWDQLWRNNEDLKAEMFRQINAGFGKGKSHISGKSDGELKEGVTRRFARFRKRIRP